MDKNIQVYSYKIIKCIFQNYLGHSIQYAIKSRFSHWHLQVSVSLDSILLIFWTTAHEIFCLFYLNYLNDKHRYKFSFGPWSVNCPSHFNKSNFLLSNPLLGCISGMFRIFFLKRPFVLHVKALTDKRWFLFIMSQYVDPFIQLSIMWRHHLSCDKNHLHIVTLRQSCIIFAMILSYCIGHLRLKNIIQVHIRSDVPQCGIFSKEVIFTMYMIASQDCSVLLIVSNWTVVFLAQKYSTKSLRIILGYFALLIIVLGAMLGVFQVIPVSGRMSSLSGHVLFICILMEW